MRDIIVGEVAFTKRIIDLTNSNKPSRFDDRGYAEFTAFSFKNVFGYE